MKHLVIIPARAGSKGLPGKNTKLLNGIPLVAYTIRSALEIFDPESICVSTDSQEVINIAESLGLNVPFIRPSYLADDTSSTRDVILHALQHFEKATPEVVILLQPTSPFRTSQHIREALELYKPEIDMVVSVKETKSNPYFVLFEENEEGFLYKSKSGNYTRRQDCPKVWEYNGALYIINAKSIVNYPPTAFKVIKKYVMDHISSHDIDDIIDWKLAEILMSKNSPE